MSLKADPIETLIMHVVSLIGLKSNSQRCDGVAKHLLDTIGSDFISRVEEEEEEKYEEEEEEEEKNNDDNTAQLFHISTYEIIEIQGNRIY